MREKIDEALDTLQPIESIAYNKELSSSFRALPPTLRAVDRVKRAIDAVDVGKRRVLFAK